MKYYPLRPELAESTLWLFLGTRDPYYQQVVGRRLVNSLNRHARVDTGGFAAIHDVETMEKENHQQSFFLSETLKYLYLLYNDSFLSNSTYDYVFTTEGHPFPIVPDIRGDAFPFIDQQLPPRYRAWCQSPEHANTAILGTHCSCLDLMICPAWAEVNPGQPLQADVESVCHVSDEFEASACKRPGDCGVDSATCRERLCSSDGFCYTP